MAAKAAMIMSVDNFLMAGNPSKINSTRGDHFPQADFSFITIAAAVTGALGDRWR
jgi:hypothetical protein